MANSGSKQNNPSGFKSKIIKKAERGVTFSELLVVVIILVVLASLAIPTFLFFQRESDLSNSTEEIVNILRLARSKTLASEGASQWGVYFSTSTAPHQYILFKGTDFSSRSTSSDEVYKLPERVEIYEINLDDLNGSSLPNPPIREVVFEKLTGKTNQPGEISLRSKDSLKVKIIQIEKFGIIEPK